jgi:nucleoid DNA-binding protein
MVTPPNGRLSEFRNDFEKLASRAGEDIGMDPYAARALAYAMMDRWVEHLANGNAVKIPFLGTLYTRVSCGYVGKNRDGEEFSRPARRVLKLSVTRNMRQLIKSVLFDQLTAMGHDPETWTAKRVKGYKHEGT